MSKTIKTLVLSALAASTVASGVAFAEVSGNVSATSNYLWRGITQNGDDAAVQGGLDYAHESGFYAGTWVSSLGDATVGSEYEGYELDLYAGYTFSAGDFTVDVGAINYMYPLEDSEVDQITSEDVKNDDSFYEFYLGAGMGPFSAKVSYSPDTDLTDGVENSGTYIEAAYTAGIFSFHVGNYTYEHEVWDTNGDGAADEDSYVDYSISVAKDDFTFGVSNTNLDFGNADDPRVFVTYKKVFEL